MHIRSILAAMAILTTGVVVGTAAQQIVSADATSGDRPVLIPIEPCRLVDTRPAPFTVGPRATKLGTQDTATFRVQQADTRCTGKIPADALALSMNVTATDAAGPESFITIWPGGTRPESASLNPVAGQPPTPNAVTTGLASGQEFSVYNNAGSVNVIIDVNGYYVNHNHDDRYASVIPFTRKPPTISTRYSFADDPTLSFDLPSAGTLSINAAILTSVDLGATATCNVHQTAPTSVTDVTNRSSQTYLGTHALTGLIEVSGPGTITLMLSCIRHSDPDNGTFQDFQVNALFVPA